jgi:DNA polymerase-1
MKFLLIDTNNYFSKFFHGAGERVIDTYLNFLNKAINQFEPDYYCNVLDAERSFRYDIYDQYKAHRPAKPKDYDEFYKLLILNFQKLKINYISSKTLEAEDSINLFVKNNNDVRFTALSSDKDCLLLYEHSNVSVFRYEGGEFEERTFIKYNIFDKEKEICAKKFLFYLCLKGDTSDNIPGVSGFGDVKIEKIIEQYQTLENLKKHLEQPNFIDKANKEFLKILQHKEDLYLSEKLIKLYNRDWKTNLSKFKRDSNKTI